MASVTIQQAFNLASQHLQARRFAEAERIYRQILAQQPQHAEAMHHLGVIAQQAGQNDMRETGQLDEAIAACRQAIALQPNFPEAHHNLGLVLIDQGQFDEAIAACRQAIAQRPHFAQAYCDLGSALAGKGQLDQAIAALRQAVAIKPNYPKALSNLGNALKETDQFDEAIAVYHQAIALQSDLAEAHSNLGNALKKIGQLDQAIAAYRQAIALKPSLHFAQSNLIYTLHFHPAYDARTIAEEHRLWNRQHAEPLRKFIQPHSNNRSPDRRLRIGYVGDLGDHPVGRFILPLLAAHDRNAFEIFCYAQVRVPDKMTAKLQAHADAWRSIVGQSDEQAAELVRQDRIDILVDLAMHSGSNRLLVFARKPAPVQVTYLAYAGGTALETIDYRLTDHHLDPDAADDGHYMEKSVRLTGTYWCYQQSIRTAPVNELPALSTGYITFACLNNFGKVSQNTLEIWAELLQAIPNARLLMHCPVGNHRAALTQFLNSRGIAADRLESVARLSPEQYFQTYHRADVGLDPFPYAGGTTTCDALWMGVPVVTLAGRTAVGRAGVSILSNAGLPGMIAHTTEQYLKIAADLANDLPHLAQLRSTLRQRMEHSPLMDAPKYARSIESAYRQMWRTWCQSGSA